MSNNEYGATHATLPSCFTSRKRSSVRLGIKKLPALGFFCLERSFLFKDSPSKFHDFCHESLEGVCHSNAGAGGQVDQRPRRATWISF